jgi:hypothetical protein
VFGYLKDFEHVKNAVCNIGGILVGWSSINSRKYSHENEIHLFSWNDYASGLRGLFIYLSKPLTMSVVGRGGGGPTPLAHQQC